jgi:plastocyanin
MRAKGWIVGPMFPLVLAGVAACGGGGYGGGGTTTPSGTAAPSGFVITIAGLRYSPAELSVPPGATITVVNNDGMAHSVTSEATRGAFVRGGVAGVSFDTGEFSSGQKTIQIPATATAGTVVPFYCSTHLATMATPNGAITVDPAAQPPATPQPTAPVPPGY